MVSGTKACIQIDTRCSLIINHFVMWKGIFSSSEALFHVLRALRLPRIVPRQREVDRTRKLQRKFSKNVPSVIHLERRKIDL
jgi:hypothetical protein